LPHHTQMCGLLWDIKCSATIPIFTIPSGFDMNLRNLLPMCPPSFFLFAE
jgi:hypothetical protein